MNCQLQFYGLQPKLVYEWSRALTVFVNYGIGAITFLVDRAEPVVASCDKVDIFIIYILSTDTV